MTRFTTSPVNANKTKWNRLAKGLTALLFWLLIWHLAYELIAQEVLLVSPVQAFMRLLALAADPAFWATVAATCLRVVQGFLLALVTGALLAVLCARFSLLRWLTAPLMAVVRATPVASFIILCLVWMYTDRIPVFIAFLMVVPMVWSNVSAGIDSADPELLEMAAVFRLSKKDILRTIYLPAILPYIAAACSTGLGFSWKAAIAAEVIAHPQQAVGRQIHNAKVYLETVDLFAWTIAVILLSLLIERLTLRLLARFRSAGVPGKTGGEGGVGPDRTASS